MPPPQIFSQAYAHRMHTVCRHAADPAFPFILHPCFCSFISCVFGRQWYHTPSHSPMSYRRITHLCNSAAASLSEPPPTPPCPNTPVRPTSFLRAFLVVTLQQVHFRGALYNPLALPPCDPSFTPTYKACHYHMRPTPWWGPFTPVSRPVRGVRGWCARRRLCYAIIRSRPTGSL